MNEDKKRDAIKFLMGLGVGPTLTKSDQRKLQELLRGPFARGMTSVEANQILAAVEL